MMVVKVYQTRTYSEEVYFRDLGVRERSCPKVIYYRSVQSYASLKQDSRKVESTYPKVFIVQGKSDFLACADPDYHRSVYLISGNSKASCSSKKVDRQESLFRICKKFEYQVDRPVQRNRRESPVTTLNRKLSHLDDSVLPVWDVTYHEELQR